MALSGIDIFKEIESALNTSAQKDVNVVTLLKVEIKMLTLILKILQNMRSNQTKVMKAQGIELLKPKTENVKENK